MCPFPSRRRFGNPYIVQITPPIEKWHGTARGGAGRGDYHHIVVSYYHIIIWSYYRYRKRRYGYSPFWLQVSIKNTNWIFYPLTKGRREKINELQAITFQGASASDAQTSVAPPKYRVIDSAPKFFWKKFAKKISSASKNEMSGIVWNAFSPSLSPIGAILRG